MTPFLAALALMDPTAESAPDPYTVYNQAVACVASAATEKQSAPQDDGAFSPLDEEILSWGVVMGYVGPHAGRTPEQIDDLDLANAQGFFEEMLERKPEAFAAHRAYCRLFRP